MMSNPPFSRSRSELRAKHKRESRLRSTHIRYDYFEQIPGIDGDIKLLRDLFRLNHYGGVAEHEFGMRLFDPKVTDLRQFPLGLLVAKEEALPPSRLPQTVTALGHLLRGFIDRGGDEDYIASVARGLPALPNGRRPPIEAYASRLWDLRRKDDPLFRRLLCSQHMAARIHAIEHGLPAGFSWEEFHRLLAAMTLLWAAEDVQRVFAIAHHAINRPLGCWPMDLEPGAAAKPWLMSDHRMISPATVLRCFELDYRDLGDILKMPGMTDAEQERLTGAILDRRPDLQERYEALRQTYDEDSRERIKRSLARILRQIGFHLKRTSGEPFWDAVSKHTAMSAAREKSFANLWFTGLSPVQSCAVSVYRYVQLERQVTGIISSSMPLINSRFVLAPVEFPGFDRKGLRSRTLDLLHHGRRVLLNDMNFHSRRRLGPDRDDDKPTKADGALDVAAKFLERMGERKPEDHHGDRHSERRTFYLLDVLPDIRLSRGGGSIARIPDLRSSTSSICYP